MQVVLGWLWRKRLTALLHAMAVSPVRARHRVTLKEVDSLVQIEEEVRTRPVAALVVDPGLVGGEGVRDFITRVLVDVQRAMPHLSIGVYCDPLPGQDLLSFGNVAIEDLVIAGHEDTPHRLRLMIQRLLRPSAIHPFLAAIPDDAPPDLRNLLHRIVANAHRPLPVEIVSAWAFTTRSNLWKRFTRAGLGAPSRWIRYARVYRVMRQVEGTGESIERSALTFGYSSGARFSDACRTLLGSPPTIIAAEGGSRRVVALLKADVWSHRRQAG